MLYRDDKFRRGLVLVTVLWLVVVLTIIITVVAQRSRLDSRVSIVGIENIRCRWACRAAIETSIAVLNDDDPESDCFEDIWSAGIEDFNDVTLTDCSFRVEVIDESSKFNLNTVTKKQLMILPDMTEAIADSILDWRDKDDTERAYGAESAYYINLPYGYECRNGNFKTVHELLRVKGVVVEMLYGTVSEYVSPGNAGWINYLTCYSYNTNTDSDGDDLIDINKANENRIRRGLDIPRSYAKWIVENRKGNYKSIGDLVNSKSPKKPSRQSRRSEDAEPVDIETYFKIVDKITITDKKVIHGKININTAGYDVLYAFFEENEKIIEEIVTYRDTYLSGFTQLSELQYIESLKIDDLKKYIDNITVRSNVFSINCRAQADMTGLISFAHAVVDRSKSPTEILYYRQGANN